MYIRNTVLIPSDSETSDVVFEIGDVKCFEFFATLTLFNGSTTDSDFINPHSPDEPQR